MRKRRIIQIKIVSFYPETEKQPDGLLIQLEGDISMNRNKLAGRGLRHVRETNGLTEGNIHIDERN